jgi:hypothetical protein
LGKIEFQQHGTNDGLIRIWVQSNQHRLFSIDLTRISGTVLQSEIVHERIAGDGDKTVAAPSANHLLLQKCEAFLNRRHTKARDAFDIDVLISKGAKLDKILGAHLDDFLQMIEVDTEIIRAKINSIDSKRCTVELRPVLPSELFEELKKADFSRLRNTLEAVFANWL